MTLKWSPDYLGSPGKMILAKDYIHGFTDPDAAAYIAAVETADGQGLEEEVRIAYSDFIVGCKSDGIWNAIKASCILAGARTLSGALVPLVGTAPTNNGPFVAADYDRKTGLKSNGSTKYLDSNRSDNAEGQDNIHISVWLSELNNGGGPIGTGGGATTGATHLYIDSISNWRIVGRCRSTSNSQITNITNSYVGFAGLSRSNTNSFDTRALGSTINTIVTSQTATGLNHTVFKRAGSAGIDARLAFYSIGEALPDLSPSQTGLALLDARVSTLISDLGAAIP